MINIPKTIQEILKEKILDFSAISNLMALQEYLEDTNNKPYITQTMINNAFLTNFDTTANLDVLDYFLNSKKLPFNAQIDCNNQLCLLSSLRNDTVDVLDYLLNCEQGKKILNIHHNQDRVYKTICDNSRLDFLTFLIIDQKIDMTPEMQTYHTKFDNDPFHQKALQLFSLRQLNEKLQKVEPNLILFGRKKKI